MSKRRTSTDSSSVVELERRIRNCKEPDCEDGYKIRVEESIVDVTAKDLDGKVTHQRHVKTRFASPCPSCRGTAPQPAPAKQADLLDTMEGARRSGAA